MDKNFNDIELTWIKEKLDQHGEYLIDLLKKSLQEKELIQTGELEQSLSYKTSMQGQNPKLSVSFLSYGRAIEINFNKKSSNTKKWTKPNTNALLLGIRNNSKLKMKKKYKLVCQDCIWKP